MLSIPLTILLVLFMALSIITTIKKRKLAGATGHKSALTPICFYSIAIVAIIAFWFDLAGLISWVLIIILLGLGAYFTKYLPVK
ncbi:hypothetical protein [Cytobacillus purgationiresistens]|uniref:Uncharacterized protein n=1 Tax=Cytobacillus purgationiresistens TaxID=863449 RepID=A0ABU0APD4_9BACI|nr:hypothetical protein [Cytobacillus purgationiresistens]MDQ0273151.1 hypothetical protein [Cytobacillus purgationiresistens]